nr:MAG TPA: hypothetical protein [Caudoviricetes sp.]
MDYRRRVQGNYRRGVHGRIGSVAASENSANLLEIPDVSRGTPACHVWDFWHARFLSAPHPQGDSDREACYRAPEIPMGIEL